MRFYPSAKTAATNTTPIFLSSGVRSRLVSAIASASFISHIKNGLILARQARVSGWEAAESLACSLLVKAFVPVLIHA